VGQQGESNKNIWLLYTAYHSLFINTTEQSIYHTKIMAYRILKTYSLFFIFLKTLIVIPLLLQRENFATRGSV